ncbi:hypothetical protein TWF506_007440 [Arthrobotrys conoides]|uniref:NAD(P)-binding protein n=1 Tax=Arthrobotrys conoides TaxID=74498 RepID=A0AAN8NR83_9PEZI
MPLIRSTKVRSINPNKYNLSGFRVLITGGETVLGSSLAHRYLSLGADIVYLVVQDLDQGEQIKATILGDEEITRRNPGCDINLYGIDPSNLDSIKTFCDQFLSDVNGLHIAVLGAEANLSSFSKTVNGLEESFQVNVVANAILSNYLVPILKANCPSKRNITEELSKKLPKNSLYQTLPSHLTWVSSESHKRSKLSDGKAYIPTSNSVFEVFNDPDNLPGELYEASKFVAMAYSLELARRLGDEKLVINSASPGEIKLGTETETTVSIPFYQRPFRAILRYIRERKPSTRAAAVIWATLCGTEGNGKSWENGAVTDPAVYLKSVDGKQFQLQIWDQMRGWVHRFNRDIPIIG